MTDGLLTRKVVAEIGSVHDGSFGNALKLIDLAADCGADIVKFQTHIAEAETMADAPMPPYFKGEPRIDYFRRTAFTSEQWTGLAEHCAARGVTFLSSPFALEAVDLLENVGVEAYKVASGEVTNTPLLERMAATGKPVLLSSGMSDWGELEQAMETLQKGGPVVLMQCTSAYPCPPERIGLNVIDEMQKRFGVPIGYSDHADGPAAAIAAAARGAVVIEKHLTFSKRMYGSDAANAMEPSAFCEMVQGLRDVWAALDNPVDKDDLTPFREMKRIFEKSIVTAHAIAAGQKIEADDLAYKKPGDGIPASRYKDVIGRCAGRDLPAECQIAEKDLV